MIEKIKYLLAGALALSSVALVGCSDEDPVFDEFDATYAYIVRPLLGVDGVEFTVQHQPDGIVEVSNKEISAPITVRLSKPMETAVTVTLGTKLEGFPDNAFSFKDGGTHVIPAGEVEVQDVLVFSNDWSFAFETKPATTYKATITIVDVQPQSGTLLISKNQGTQFLTVNKKLYFASNIIPNKEPTGKLIDLRTNWVVMWTAYEDYTEWKTTPNVTDGKTTYVSNEYGVLAISIDLGAEQTITGLRNTASSSTYAHNNCVIYSSNDGVDWKRESDPQQRDVVTAKADQFLSFKKPVKARYIRWDMWNTASTSYGRCRSNEINVYIQ